ncbi:MAG: MATE family efflux transporter [Marinilabiliales bacterium]|nr:MATE family efflux transporter [Marinilabiliales bacterium]
MNTQFIKYGGDIAVGAMGIVSSTTMMMVMTIISINMAIQPIIGFNYGAGLYCRVKETAVKAIKVRNHGCHRRMADMHADPGTGDKYLQP